MKRFIALFEKEILEQIRTRKVLVMMIVMLFIAVSSPIIAKITPELLKNISVPGLTVNLPDPSYKESIDQFIKNISQIAALVIIFVVSGIVCEEKNKKTLEITLTKPISRQMFILSKYLSFFASFSVIFIVSSLIFYLYTASVFGGFNFCNFTLMSLSVLIYLLLISSVVIFLSSIFKNSILAGGVGFLVYVIIGTVFGLIDSIKKFSPDYIFSNYQSVIANGYSNDLLLSILISIIAIILLIIASIWVFKYQEVER